MKKAQLKHECSIASNVPSLCISGGFKKTDFPINN